MLNNVSFEKISFIVNELTVKTINQTSDYLSTTTGSLLPGLLDNYGISTPTIETMADELITVAHVLSENASEFLLHNVTDPIRIVFAPSADYMYEVIAFILNIISQCMDRFNHNRTMFMTVHIICLYVFYKFNEMRRDFDHRMEEMRVFIDDNEYAHMRIIDESRTEFKTFVMDKMRRVNNNIKKLRAEKAKHSIRQDKLMYERIRAHHHEELRARICMYLDLFNQYASGDKYNVLFNLSDDVLYMNPQAEGAVVKKYFSKYFAFNNSAKCHILYPLNLAHSPNIVAEYSRNIRNYADSLPANSVKELSQFREEVETNYAELFSFPVVRAPGESQMEFEISVFKYVDECLGGCYKTYNMYCSAGLN